MLKTMRKDVGSLVKGFIAVEKEVRVVMDVVMDVGNGIAEVLKRVLGVRPTSTKGHGDETCGGGNKDLCALDMHRATTKDEHAYAYMNTFLSDLIK